MPTPTIGAKVHFYLPHRAEPYLAVITGITGDVSVNLSVSDLAGKTCSMLDVPLVADEDNNPLAPPYATWPKVEAAVEKIETSTEKNPPPVKAEKKPRRKSKKK